MSADVKTDPWAWWQAALAGKAPPVHENEPQQGFYRVANDPVAIWFEAGEAVAMRRDREVDAGEVWTWACRKPTAHALYLSVMDGGEWPESIDKDVAAAAGEPGIGHNSGEPHELVLDELGTVERAFRAWLAEIGGAVATDEQDAKVESYQKRLAELGKKAEATRDTLVRPHLEAQRAINATWKPVVTQIDEIRRGVGSTALPYRTAKEAARKEAERVAREEAARAAQAAAKAAAEGREPPPPPPPPVAARPAKKGFREVKITVVTDLAAACAFLVANVPDPLDLEQVVRVMARRLIESGVPVPGVEVRTEQRA